ncbi:MAG TPA: 30S ribosomal protein S12 methylthiotransferase RimO [Thermodesulfovibrionales bacterium]|jgi:ribosomal protein S12 methylthiotransferase|nr:30S ribosomal protein S12 methylthiotransferase RimO [Thermodesulfovibrionales bacterium]
MDKISIVSLGCPKNRVDSEDLLKHLREEGFIHTPEPEDADLVFVNTCGFIEDAKRESIEEILKLKALKEKGKQLLVFGCLAQRYRDDLLTEIPEIDGLWGVGEEGKILEYCRNIKGRDEGFESGCAKAMSRPAASSSGVSSFAYLKIADGCNRGCTFCVIPSIRGPFRSMRPDDILRRAESFILSGVRELVLVAQDIGNYGREFGGYTLPSLLKDISSISGDFWIRLLYLYPTAISDELLSVVAYEPKICKYLDIPLQHSEDRILRAMGRGGTRKWHKAEIEKIRESIPDITLRTTLIVGFPGETEEDFDGLKDFVEEVRFERLGVFTYSREEGSAAYGMKGNVPKKIRERRRDEIMRIQSVISLEKNKALVGKRFRALVDDVEGGITIGRLSSQAPEIDGVVFLGDGGPDDPSQSKTYRLKPGDFRAVEIVNAFDYDLKGVLLDGPMKYEEGNRQSEITDQR